MRVRTLRGVLIGVMSRTSVVFYVLGSGLYLGIISVFSLQLTA